VIETTAGEEAQVDFGTGPMVRDPHSRKYRRMRLFVMTLGYSRKSVRLLVFHSSTQTWAELHEQAFRRLGGCTRVVVLDNLREGVLKPDVYDPTINPVYADMLKHYGVVAMPCRVVGKHANRILPGTNGIPVGREPVVEAINDRAEQGKRQHSGVGFRKKGLQHRYLSKIGFAAERRLPDARLKCGAAPRRNTNWRGFPRSTPHY
jgi:transposase